MGRLSLIWPLLKASIYQPGLATLWWRGHSVFRQTWTSITKTELAIGPIQCHWPNGPSNPGRTSQYGQANSDRPVWTGQFRPGRSGCDGQTAKQYWSGLATPAWRGNSLNVALLCFTLLCFALLCFALLCSALLYFALLCFALLGLMLT